MKKKSLTYLYSNLEKLGSHFNEFIFESEAGIACKDIIDKNTGELNSDKVFKKSEGAVVYIPSDDRKDINTAVFINSEGNPTYAAKDIGLLDIKFTKYNPDLSVFVTDGEQIPHFRVVMAAASDIGDEWKSRADRSLHIPHGRMTLRGQKMSSRNGGVPSADEVIDSVLDVVIEKSQDKINDLAIADKMKLQEDIALAALRISILRSKPGLNIDFDPDRATSFEGDSGPYLCYTHARCASLLEKGSAINLSTKVDANTEVTDLERKLIQWENVLKISIAEIAPQKLIFYLFELAQEFNSFYAANTIISDDLSLSSHRLYIVSQMKNTLQKSLYILGINAPDKM
jgi:arginyl-tRNA synthetase